MPDLYPSPVDYDAERDGLLCDLADCRDWLVVGEGDDPEDAAWIAEDWEAFCAAGKWPAFEFMVEGCTVFGRFRGTKITPAKRRNGPTPLRRIAEPAPMAANRDIGSYLRGQTEHKRWGART